MAEYLAGRFSNPNTNAQLLAAIITGTVNKE